MQSLWRFKPFAVLLLFVLADKLLLFPPIRDRLTLAPDLSFDILSMAEQQEFKDHSRYEIWAFGTSRTLPFRRLKSPASELTNNKRAGETIRTFALPGAVPLIYLHQYLYLREQGYKPDAVWIEVSPFAVNHNYSLRDAFLYETAPDRFIVAHLAKYPPSFLRLWLKGHLLAGSIYPPGLYSAEEKALVQFLNPLNQQRKDQPARAEFTALQLEQKQKDRNYRSFFRKVYLEGHLPDFQIDPVAADSLHYLISEIQSDGIPFMIWNPPVHASLERLYDEAGVNPSFRELIQSLEGQHFPELNMFSCNLYRDESHLADACFSELARQLIVLTRRQPMQVK